MELKKEMSAMEIRLIMKNNGWNSEDRLTKVGWANGFGYSIWFERWDWHNVKVNKVCIHSHTGNLNEIDKITYETAVRCLIAWNDFIDSVPQQVADGSLEENIISTPFFRSRKKTNAKD